MYLGLGVFLLAQREGFVSALPRATRAFAPKQFFPTLFCCLCRAKPAARENPIVRLTLGTDFPSPNIWVLSAARGEEKMNTYTFLVISFSNILISTILGSKGIANKATYRFNSLEN